LQDFYYKGNGKNLYISILIIYISFYLFENLYCTEVYRWTDWI